METKPDNILDLEKTIPGLVIDFLYDVDTSSPEAVNLHVQAWYSKYLYPLPHGLRQKTEETVNKARVNGDAEQVGIQWRLTKPGRAKELARRQAIRREVEIIPVAVSELEINDAEVAA